MRIALLGAGQIGCAVARILAPTEDFKIDVYDADQSSLDAASAHVSSAVRQHLTPESLRPILDAHEAVINALPFSCTSFVAAEAVKAERHYFDLTEDVESAHFVAEAARDARCIVAPQCGLAPGVISIVGNAVARTFDSVRELRLRVGALPQYPTNSLGYNLNWSTDGLLNEYVRPCEVLLDGRPTFVEPLGSLEKLWIDGTAYEAFSTSGGLGTLCRTWAGKIDTLDYKTIRYPGHRDLMHFLLHDLRLAQDLPALRDILERALPTTTQDVVVIQVSAIGMRADALVQETYAAHIPSRQLDDGPMSAIQLTTASSVCALVDLVRERALAQRGLLRQEDVPLDLFLSNRFGATFRGLGERTIGPS